MTKKSIIPLVELQIADNLFIQIKDVSFIPATKGVYNALPENCYPDEPAECDWLEENAKLVIKKFEYKEVRRLGRELIFGDYESRYKKVKKLISEHEFTVDDSFFYEYYDEIITAIEEMGE